jgi:hypothetical protein
VLRLLRKVLLGRLKGNFFRQISRSEPVTSNPLPLSSSVILLSSVSCYQPFWHCHLFPNIPVHIPNSIVKLLKQTPPTLRIQTSLSLCNTLLPDSFFRNLNCLLLIKILGVLVEVLHIKSTFRFTYILLPVDSELESSNEMSPCI